MAKQLQTAEEVIKRKIKQVKGSKVYLRVFPDIPVCTKVAFTPLAMPSDSLSAPAVREMKHVWGRPRERLSSGRRGTSLSSTDPCIEYYFIPAVSPLAVWFSKSVVHPSGRNWLVKVSTLTRPTTEMRLSSVTPDGRQPSFNSRVYHACYTPKTRQQTPVSTHSRPRCDNDPGGTRRSISVTIR